jgi:polysaccharide export outer membrane protein
MCKSEKFSPRSCKFGMSEVVRLLFLASLFFLPSIFVQAQPSGTTNTPITTIASARPDDQRYRIGPGDVLDIRVFNKPLLSRDNVRVGNDGTIRMPLLEGEIKAVCKTEQELANELTKRYLEYLRAPQVDVFVKEYNSQPVAVIGAVRLPSRFQLRSRVRLLELMPLAGGLTEKAGRTVQIVHTAPTSVCDARQTNVGPDDELVGAISNYDLKEVLRGDERANPVIRPGDVVSVQEAESVYVVGNVYHPSEVLLKEQITVTRALAMAGGTMPDSKLDKVRIQRQSPGSTERKEIFVDIKAIRKRQAEDVVLQAGDIVDVPTAEGKRFIKSLFGTLPTSISQLPLRVIP